MISTAGQNALHRLVNKEGRSGLESLVQKRDLDGLKNAGLSEVDAHEVLLQARTQGFDSVFELAQRQDALGGRSAGTAAGGAFVSTMAGQTRAPLSALTAVKGGTALDGVDAAKVREFNLHGVTLPKEITKLADVAFGGRPTRIADAGYSAPPSGTMYAEHTEQFLGDLADKLGKGNVGLVSSPTADAGSIDAITTMVGQRRDIPVLSVTSKDYVGYIDPNKFPADIDKAKYAAQPKYVLPDNAKYNQATALASNAFVATGGRDVTVFDFMRAIEANHPVVLVVDDSMTKALGDKSVWDADKNRVNNGAAYLAEQITSFLKTGEMTRAPVGKDGFGKFDAEWMDDCKLLLEKNVKIVHISGPDDIGAAAAVAAKHIGAFTQPSRAETMAGFAPASVDDVKTKFQDQYLEHAYQYTALTSEQLAKQTEGVPGAPAHIGEAHRLLDNLVHLTVRHFGGGSYGMLDEAHMNTLSVKQHAGYVAGELSRKLGIDEKNARDVLVPFYESTMGGASPEQRAKLASDLQVARLKQETAPIRGQELTGEMDAIKRFVTDDNNGWMFNQYGFGDADKALNRPGVYAGEAVRDLAESIAGNGANALLRRALERSPTELAKALAEPRTTEDFVACFAARAAQAGWLVSKTGQGIVEANNANPQKAERGLTRFAPKNDLITDFDSLAQKKGWAEVAKDLDQVKTALWASGALS